MRAKPFVTTLFVISLVGSAVVITHVMLQQKVVASEPKEFVLAATVPLPTGTLLREQDVTWQGVIETRPDQIVRPSATVLAAKPELEDQTRTSVYGAVLRHPLVAGEPIEKAAFVKPGDRDFLQVVLSPGSRAIAIPVSTGGASTGLLQPGDRVDVVLTQNFKNDSAQDLHNTPLTRRSVSETVVDNLRVLAIDTPDPKVTGAAANPANGNFGRTVTLEVTPEQVEQINVAAELGKLSVALRSVVPSGAIADSSGPQRSTTLATTAPIDNTDKAAGDKVKRIQPQWAGDVSPALYGAAEPKPVALTSPPIQVFHGAGKDQGNVRTETVKTEN